MVSVVAVLFAILTIGFVGVGLVGFMGWRQRMRRDEEVDLDYSKAGCIPMGVDCHSPNRFEAFSDARGLLDLVARVRTLTGKPVGLKMGVGSDAVSATPMSFIGVTSSSTSRRA